LAPSSTKACIHLAPSSTEPCIHLAPSWTEPFIHLAPSSTKPFIHLAPSSTEPSIHLAPSSTEPYIHLAPSLTKPCILQVSWRVGFVINLEKHKMLLVPLDCLIEHKCSITGTLMAYISVWTTVLYTFFDVDRTVSPVWKKWGMALWG
jgi:hypothetical protein